MEGGIEKRGKNSWTLVYDLPRGPDGKRRQKWVSFVGTKRAAQAERARLVAEVRSGDYHEASRWTLAEYLRYWLDHHVKSQVAEATHRSYTQQIGWHIGPGLGHIPLAKLSPTDITSYFAKVLGAGNKKRPGGLSPQTVRLHHAILSAALTQAVKWRLIARDPLEHVPAPRKRPPTLHILDAEQAKVLLETLADNRLYLPVLLVLTTGLRRGEVLGLRWCDVDLERRLLVVRQSLRPNKTVGPPKSGKPRPIRIPQVLVEALRAARTSQDALRERLGPDYADHDLICCEADGSPVRPQGVTTRFHDLVARLPLPPVRFHDLRHSYATHQMEDGVATKTVQETLGHHSPGFTLAAYGHVLPAMQDAAADAVDRRLGASDEKC